MQSVNTTESSPLALTRCVRLFVPIGADATTKSPPVVRNGFAGWPPPDTLSLFVELAAEVRGMADPVSGYLLGIDRIDAAVRDAALPLLTEAVQSNTPPITLMPALFDVVEKHLADETANLSTLTWHLSPRHAILVETTMHPSSEQTIMLRERFEFAAAHRLHCADASDEWNRSTFGKCNNPAGHGHNYEFEVTVAIDGNDSSFSFTNLETIVKQAILDRFDHKHLNEDCPEFADRNPSVENITLVCHGLLDVAMRDTPARLHTITVWETGKTSCTYPA